MNANTKHLIIGAGPTGLGAGYRLHELGCDDFEIIEASDRVGGLARSFTDAAGFTWDIGGHVQFSHYDYFDRAMIQALGQEGWLHHIRESWIWMRGRFVPYPFQNNLRYLPREEQARCIEGLLDRSAAAPGLSNFRDWILQSFGRGIADAFMFPYNFKVWAHPAEVMSATWVGERVAQVDLRRSVTNILLEKDDVSWGPNSTFQFPRAGGTGAIWEGIARCLPARNICLEETITAIDSLQKRAFTSKGRVVDYENILTTMPLDRFVALVKDLDPERVRGAHSLLHSSSHIVGIGLRGSVPENLRSKCWMYFPEDDCPFYRVTVFSNYSPGNVPSAGGPFWSLMTETSESPWKPVRSQTLIEETIAGLKNTGLIEDKSEIVSRWQFSAEYGYPIPSVDRDALLASVHPHLHERRIFSRGRFGGWKYEVSNQDHSFMQGVEWANLVELGIPEITYPFPNWANTGYARKQ